MCPGLDSRARGPYDPAMFARAFLAWLAMLAVAVAFGALRELAVKPWLGDAMARALCSVLLAAVLAAMAARFARGRGPLPAARLMALGAFFAGLTLAFEFSMGWARGASLEAMLADYDVLEGRLWPLVPLALLLGPLLAGRRTTGIAPTARP